MKARTLTRLFVPLSMVFALGLLVMPLAHVVPASAPPRPAYRFALVQGQGVAVCEAYLARLNMTDYQDPPYCDRPEHDAIPGFTRLQRVPVSAEAVQALLPRVRGFTEQKIKIYMTSGMPEGNTMVCPSLNPCPM